MQSVGRRTSIPHVSALDGARGAAVAAVLLFHDGHLTGGYLGVDLFFTLSGFLITSLLLAETERNGSVGLGGFWSRRARRLLPALAVLFAGIVLYCAFLAKPVELSQIRGDALATLAYSANWRSVFAHQSYFALFSAPSPLQHTWSLAIEEQFYLIWPLVFVGLIAAFKRGTPKAVLVTALALAAGSSILMIALYSPGHTNRDYYGTDTRVASILLGAALAAWLALRGPTKQRRARVALEVLGLAGVVVLAIAWTRLDGQSATLYRGGFLVVGLAATAIIAAGAHPDRGPIARVLSWGPLCALGLISYGVYLYHWPIDIVLDQERVGLRGWPLFAVQTTVTVVVAIASYKLIEQPIRHGAIRPQRLGKLAPAIAVGLIVALVVATAGAQPLPYNPLANKDPLQTARHAFRHARPGSIRVMVVGNSEGYFLAEEGFAAIRTTHRPQLTVLDASVPACVFPPDLASARATANGVPQPPCHPSWEPQAVKLYRPRFVFWMTSDPVGAVGTYHGQRVRACSEPYDSLYERRLTREVTTLGATGARVVLPTDAYSRIYGETSGDRTTDCENRIRRKVAAATGAEIVDLNGYVCPHHECHVKLGGVRLRPDGLHYQGHGARVIATWLMNQVLGR